MSLFIRENPLIRRNNNSLFGSSLFDEFDNELFNHPLISFNSLYPYYFSHPGTLEKQTSKEFEKEKELFKTIDFTPKINLSEDEKNYYIHADVPGLNKDQIKMELSEDNHFITISGERKTIINHSEDKENENKNENKNENETKTESIETNETKDETKKESKNESKKENNTKYSKIECSYGKFSRSFSIPENADVNTIQAKLENGVLEVTIAKIEPPKQEPKHTIQIQ
ncbi:hypothetical protein PIROE2DRAFT_9257 [Piromyces sp. E2]|nr:hypothetical protein PIROE2DRAFT_9257 [Piromyces sp. E2]|eukprot:OUM64092.1 hypothetical protein PIROE2DRAFT_9257 [Piromyces sp. E2]